MAQQCMQAGAGVCGLGITTVIHGAEATLPSLNCRTLQSAATWLSSSTAITSDTLRIYDWLLRLARSS